MPRRDNMRKAKEIIASHRAKSIQTQEEHTKEAEAVIPQLSEIGRELSMTGLKIMGEAMAHTLSEERLGEIRKEYDALAMRKRNLLLAFGFPEDYTDIKYHCPLCSDTGYVGIDMCKCLRRELVLCALESSGLSSLIKNQNFETFSLDYYENNDKMMMEHNVNAMKAFAENFSEQAGQSWLFVGPTGLGKTHLSTAVAVELIKKGCDVVYESTQQIMTDYETVRFSSGYSTDREMPDLTKRASIDLPAPELTLLQDGIDRPRKNEDHAATLPVGGALTFTFDAPEQLSELRIVFDPDFTRETISPNKKMRVFAQRLHTGKDFVPVKVAATLVRTFTVEADGKTVAEVSENYHSLVKLPLNLTAKTLTVRFNETWGADTVRLYACDVK